MIRLGIVDDDAMVRTGLAFILGGEADIEVAWQAGNGIEALEHLAAQGADLLFSTSACRAWMVSRPWTPLPGATIELASSC